MIAKDIFLKKLSVCFCAFCIIEKYMYLCKEQKKTSCSRFFVYGQQVLFHFWNIPPEVYKISHKIEVNFMHNLLLLKGPSRILGYFPIKETLCQRFFFCGHFNLFLCRRSGYTG